MIEKKQTNEKCPKCERGYLQSQYWGSHQQRVTCSNPECAYVYYDDEVL
jgi:ribosomal protein S27AE